MWLGDDLMENLKAADKFAAQIKEGADKVIQKTGMDAPEEDQPELGAGHDSEVIGELDLEDRGIRTIIWATGYAYDSAACSSSRYGTSLGIPCRSGGSRPALGSVSWTCITSTRLHRDCSMVSAMTRPTWPSTLPSVDTDTSERR